VDWDPVTFVAALSLCAIVAAAAVEDCRCVLGSWKCDDSRTCEIWANPILTNVNWRGTTKPCHLCGDPECMWCSSTILEEIRIH
jgi:hypothetical protein